MNTVIYEAILTDEDFQHLKPLEEQGNFMSNIYFTFI